MQRGVGSAVGSTAQAKSTITIVKKRPRKVWPDENVTGRRVVSTMRCAGHMASRSAGKFPSRVDVPFSSSGTT